MSEEGSAPPRTVSELLRKHSATFTGADRKVVRALQADYPRAGLESLPKLAARAGISAPTVLRMLAKLGYSSYGEFQAALHDEVTERMSEPATRSRQIAAAEGSDVLGGSLAVLSRGVVATGERIDRAEFEAAVELLSNSKRPVITLGGFESEVCASHLATLLSQIRVGVRYCPRGSTSAVFEMLDIQRRHVIVAFDFRRYQTSTMDALRFAHERQAAIVLFTDRWISPASDLAQLVFVCDSSGVGPFDSRVACVAVIESLVGAVTSAVGGRGEQRIESVYELLAGSTWGERLSDDPGTQPNGDPDPSQ